MNIETNTVSANTQTDAAQKSNITSSAQKQEKSFKDEINNLKDKTVSESDKTENTDFDDQNYTMDINSDIGEDSDSFPENPTQELNEVISQINTNQVNQTDEITSDKFNKSETSAVNIYKGQQDYNSQMLNNDMNIYNVQQEQTAELKADISFAQNNSSEEFSSFLSNNNLNESMAELQEDESILSTTAENIAMINKTLTSAHDSIGKVKNAGEVTETIISASVMNLSTGDIAVLLNLAAGNNAVINDVSSIQDINSPQYVTTLANMLSESMKNNKAFRINFDNEISVIIKVSSEGRISANFIPGSNAAENYLRNNMANLVQKFEEENLPYDELSHQKQKRNNEQENKKDDDDV